MIETIHNKRVIVAPLFWGLGHSTRCIPIINQLIGQSNQVAIASDGEALDLLKKEFPYLDHFVLPSYNISYKSSSMILNMITQAPKIMGAIHKESKSAESIAEKWSADVILSDNRLGFKSKRTENIYMTHQISIPSKSQAISQVANQLHRKYINRFDHCLVPDFQGEHSLAGKMTEGELKIPKHFIGSLSRLKKEDIDIKYDYTAILSGPEPQRTILEQEIIKIFSAKPHIKTCIVRGTSAPNETKPTDVGIHDLLDTTSINRIINESTTIICRAGYTSIMDLVALQKRAVLIPTPGQYEQKYLAEYLDGKYGFRSMELEQLVSKVK